MREAIGSLFLSAWSVYGQSAVATRFDPTVIVPGSTTTVRLEIEVAGTPSRVTYEPWSQPGTELDMKDDGTGGDRTAGDKVYTILLPAAPMVNGMRADDVFRPSVGYFYAHSGTTRVVTGGVMAEIADPSIPRLNVVKDANDVQHTDYVVNIKLPSAFPLINGNYTAINDQRGVANRFFQIFPDEFDVLSLCPTIWAGMAIQVVDTLFQVFGNSVRGLEVGVVEGGLLQNEEPGLDKVQPRSVRWCPVELDVGWSGGPEIARSLVSTEVIPD